MKKILFSYSLNDTDAKLFIESFKNEMSMLDLELIDFDNIPFGLSMYDYITEAVNSCDFFICFINTNNTYIMFELGYALGTSKNILIIGEHNDVPSVFRTMRYFHRSIKSYEFLSYLGEYMAKDDTSQGKDCINIKSLDVNNLIATPEVINKLNGFDFENIIAKWFVQKGYKITQPQNNTVYDFKILSFDGNPTIVEVKKYSKISSVPISASQQLMSSMHLENVNNGIIISNSRFTKAALSFAMAISPQIILWTLDDLVTLKEYKE
jgi:hypothetical protein